MSSAHNRRNFLALTGAGVAVAGVAAAMPAGAASDPGLPSGAEGPLVAYVGDLRDDHVALMVGDREVVIQDAALVARLARAAR